MNLDSLLNFLVPAILLLIALGFVYTKFIQPWVVPHLIKFWEWMQGKSTEDTTKKEIVFE
jgi:hypothetical protein